MRHSRLIRFLWHSIRFRDRVTRHLQPLKKIRRRLRTATYATFPLLVECYGRSCPNNRVTCPIRRSYATTHTIHFVKQQHTGSHLSILMWGSGGCAHEATFLISLLEQMQLTSIAITLVDITYDSYLATWQKYTPHSNFNLAAISAFPEYRIHTRSNILLHYQFKQLMMLVTSQFPRVACDWRVTTDAKIEDADLFVAFDADPPVPQNHESKTLISVLTSTGIFYQQRGSQRYTENFEWLKPKKYGKRKYIVYRRYRGCYS